MSTRDPRAPRRDHFHFLVPGTQAPSKEEVRQIERRFPLPPAPQRYTGIEYLLRSPQS